MKNKIVIAFLGMMLMTGFLLESQAFGQLFRRLRCCPQPSCCQRTTCCERTTCCRPRLCIPRLFLLRGLRPCCDPCRACYGPCGECKVKYESNEWYVVDKCPTGLGCVCPVDIVSGGGGGVRPKTEDIRDCNVPAINLMETEFTISMVGDGSTYDLKFHKPESNLVDMQWLNAGVWRVKVKYCNTGNSGDCNQGVTPINDTTSCPDYIMLSYNGEWAPIKVNFTESANDQMFKFGRFQVHVVRNY